MEYSGLDTVQKVAIRQALVSLRARGIPFTRGAVTEEANRLSHPKRRIMPEQEEAAVAYASEIGTPESQQPDSVMPQASWEGDKRDREVLLERARDAVMRGREETYGSPENSFALIAKFWEAYLGVEIAPADVAAMMGLLKLARLRADPTHEDSWTDLAGYAANGYEVSRGGSNG